ncbi:transcriptional regulator [Cognatiluteimonas profundi]|uniref:transcriptional regulator n=1 Tax=Cognatiluteimonas profundi TaxID=2594501 RepID=UPI00131CE15A|nr:transcriptional regulator [Lysobacter profundi]
MKDEKAEFAARLRTALKDAGIEASPAVIEKRFNSRYRGAPVTAQAISGWLNGKSMPKQDKIRVLAAIVGLEPHELQFGGKSRIGEGPAVWEAMSTQDRAVFEAFVGLPVAQRKLVRELIMALSAPRIGSKGV